MDPKVQNNIISMGISLEAQLKSIEQFIKNNERKRPLLCIQKIIMSN